MECYLPQRLGDSFGSHSGKELSKVVILKKLIWEREREKTHLIYWKDVKNSKENEGLGIGNLVEKITHSCQNESRGSRLNGSHYAGRLRPQNMGRTRGWNMGRRKTNGVGSRLLEDNLKMRILQWESQWRRILLFSVGDGSRIHFGEYVWVRNCTIVSFADFIRHLFFLSWIIRKL